MTHDEYSKQILKTKPNFTSLSNSHISNDCKDLIKGMLNLNINERLSLSEIKTHVWLLNTQKVIEQKEIDKLDIEGFISGLNQEEYLYDSISEKEIDIQNTKSQTLESACFPINYNNSN